MHSTSTAGAAQQSPTQGSIKFAYEACWQDLDGSRNRAAPGSWNANATITVHDADHHPVPGAVVIGEWSHGPTSSCATDASGRCVITATNLPNKTGSALMTIVTVTHDGFVYLQGANHDPDGDSDGTTIGVPR